MKTLSFAFIITATLCGTSIRAGVPQSRTLRDIVKEARHEGTIRLSVATTRPQMSLMQVVDESDLIVRCRLQSGRSRLSPGDWEIYTDFTVTPIQVLLQDSIRPVPGPTRPLIVAVPGGDMEIDGRRVIWEDYGFQPFKAGSEAVLFLEWNPALNVYEIVGGPYGAFEINQGVAEPRAVQSLERRQEVLELVERINGLLSVRRRPK